MSRASVLIFSLAVLLLASSGRGEQGFSGLSDLLPSQDEFLRREPVAVDGVVSVFTDWKLWKEDGRSFLSDIERTRVAAGVAVLFPGDCLISAVRERWANDFAGSGSYDAEGFGLHADVKLLEELSVNAGFISRDNEKREAADTESYYLQLSWASVSEIVVQASFERKDEFFNIYGLLQGTQADAYTVSVEGGDAILYELGAELKRYTDNNEVIRALASGAREFAVGSGVMKTSLAAEYRDARWKNYYLLFGDRLSGIIFPYWAPRNYAAASLGLDYSLCYSDDGSIAAHAAATFDSEDDLGLDARFRLSHKYAFAECIFYTSDEWDAEGYGVGLQFSF